MRKRKLKEEWTANVIGRLHRLNATQAELARRCGYTPQYLCMVLNCKKIFESEYAKKCTQKKILKALCTMEEEILGGEHE